MRIALDLRRIGNPGIGRYMHGLVRALLALPSEHRFLLLLPSASQEFPDVTPDQAETIVCDTPYYSVREQIELPRLLRRCRADLLHSPHFLMPLRPPCRTVVTIHDVIYLACKEDLPSAAARAYYSAMMRSSARLADAIITDSHFSKGDIVRRLKIPPEKIEVIHCGISPAFLSLATAREIAAARQRHNISGVYILFAGIYKPRKNHAGLLRAFAELRDRGVIAELVITGPMAEGKASLKKMARELGIAEQVVFTGQVSDAELRALYSGAAVYACPSLYEGFGFTILEAMACGTPVVCSDATALPEIAGDAALIANARQPAEFAAALERVLNGPNLRSQLVARGHRNCRRFVWHEAARHTLDVYESVACETRKAAFA